MTSPSDLYLQQQSEFLRYISQKMAITRDLMQETFAREVLQANSSTNVNAPETRFDLSDPRSNMLLNSGTILSQDRNLKDCNGMFQFLLNVAHFTPDEIVTKVVGDFIVVYGKHDELFDGHCWTSREFTRQFKIPADVDSFTMRSVMDDYGVLVITAAKKISEPAAVSVRIPIEIEKQY